MAQPSFKYGSRAQYNATATKDPSVLYFLLDTGEIFRGDVNLAQTKHYEIIRNLNETDASAIARSLNNAIPVNGDICAIKTLVATNKYAYSLFTYNNNKWNPLTQSHNAADVYLTNDIVLPDAIIATAGKSVIEILSMLFLREGSELNSISIDGQVLTPVNQNIDLPIFSNVTSGLVPIVSNIELSERPKHFLNAAGTWAIPVDSRIGNLTYKGQNYQTVDTYVTAVVNGAALVWEMIE